MTGTALYFASAIMAELRIERGVDATWFLFLLTLLGHAPGRQAMPSTSRWHILGGERTSPFFKAPRDDVAVVGIDCKAELFGADERGVSVMPRETASCVSEPDETYRMSPTLIPIAATFSRFLDGYAASCRESNLTVHASR